MPYGVKLTKTVSYKFQIDFYFVNNLFFVFHINFFVFYFVNIKPEYFETLSLF